MHPRTDETPNRSQTSNHVRVVRICALCIQFSMFIVYIYLQYIFNVFGIDDDNKRVSSLSLSHGIGACVSCMAFVNWFNSQMIYNLCCDDDCISIFSIARRIAWKNEDKRRRTPCTVDGKTLLKVVVRFCITNNLIIFPDLLVWCNVERKLYIFSRRCMGTWSFTRNMSQSIISSSMHRSTWHTDRSRVYSIDNSIHNCICATANVAHVLHILRSSSAAAHLNSDRCNELRSQWNCVNIEMNPVNHHTLPRMRLLHFDFSNDFGASTQKIIFTCANEICFLPGTRHSWPNQLTQNSPSTSAKYISLVFQSRRHIPFCHITCRLVRFILSPLASVGRREREEQMRCAQEIVTFSGQFPFVAWIGLCGRIYAGPDVCWWQKLKICALCPRVCGWV